MPAESKIRVEVAFALPEHQEIIELLVDRGCTAKMAIESSGIATRFPDLILDELAAGIFSRPLNGVELPLPEEYILAAEDRVEIYRPLAMDPKQARLERARKKTAQGNT